MDLNVKYFQIAWKQIKSIHEKHTHNYCKRLVFDEEHKIIKKPNALMKEKKLMKNTLNLRENLEFKSTLPIKIKN